MGQPRIKSLSHLCKVVARMWLYRNKILKLLTVALGGNKFNTELLFVSHLKLTKSNQLEKDKNKLVANFFAY